MRISDWSSDVCSSDLARRVRQRGKPVFEGRQVLKDRELIPVERRAADDKGVESPRPRQQRVRGEQAAERMAEQDLLGPVRLRIARRDFGAQRLDEKEIGRASCRERVCQYV